MSTPNAIRLETIESNIIRLENHYDGDCDLFDDKIQMNYIDYDLLDVIRKQNAVIVDLESRLALLEVFTGMTAAAPLPVDDGKNDMVLTVAGWVSREIWDDHAERIFKDNNQIDDSAPTVTFAAGSVEYGDGPKTAQLDDNGDLYY